MGEKDFFSCVSAILAPFSNRNNTGSARYRLGPEPKFINFSMNYVWDIKVRVLLSFAGQCFNFVYLLLLLNFVLFA